MGPYTAYTKLSGSSQGFPDGDGEGAVGLVGRGGVGDLSGEGWVGPGESSLFCIVMPSRCRAAPIESLMKLIWPHYKRVPPLK